jgi:hypothetical protein
MDKSKELARISNILNEKYKTDIKKILSGNFPRLFLYPEKHEFTNYLSYVHFLLTNRNDKAIVFNNNTFKIINKNEINFREIFETFSIIYPLPEDYDVYIKILSLLKIVKRKKPNWEIKKLIDIYEDNKNSFTKCKKRTMIEIISNLKLTRGKNGSRRQYKR